MVCCMFQLLYVVWMIVKILMSSTDLSGAQLNLYLVENTHTHYYYYSPI